MSHLLRRHPLRFLLPLLLLPALSAPLDAQTVLVAPYLQPGDGATLEKADVKSLLWITDQKAGEFTVEYAVNGGAPQTARAPTRLALDFKVPKPKPATGKPPTTPPAIPVAPTPAPKPTAEIPSTLEELKQQIMRESSVPVPDAEQHFFRYTASLLDLPFDSTVHYRVLLAGKLVREGTFKTRVTATKPIRFVAVGDLANGKAEQNAVAFQISQQKPDFMIALGDIVYSQGRVSQYMHHFWPTYNDVAAPSLKTGAPLFQTLPLYPVVGNHDMEMAKLPDYPDAWAAYYFYQVPLNGPGLGAWNLPLGKDGGAAAALRARAGSAYPAVNIYSWDDGPAHFIALDSSTYVKADDPALRAWLEKDLSSTKQPWKFVCYHAPAFHTSREHYTEQRMRLWEDLFEKYGVDLVFAGHVHNYQRSKPLHFTQTAPRDVRGRINGDFRLDEKFDGVKNTVPDGVIHIVSGGGGASLYSVDLAKTVAALQKDHAENYVPLTAKYVGQHSFSLVDLTPTKLTLRQISLTGEEVDRFVITKPAGGAAAPGR